MTETLPRERRPRPAEASDSRRDWAADSLDELLVTSRPMCETAVDATDIAVMLETGGINDAVAAGTYGASDTHDLAERMMRAIPVCATTLTLATPDRVAEAHTARRLVLRGVLYAAPGAFYLAIAADLRTQWAGLAVVAATVAGWTASQVIGLIAHRLTVRTGNANTHAVLRGCVASSAALAIGLAAAIAPAVGYQAASVLAAQVIFASAAAVLLFYDADRALAWCVIPGALVAVACVVGQRDGEPTWPVSVAMCAAVATALAAVSAAWALRSAARPTPAPAGRQYPTAREWAGTVPYVLYGMLCAVALASGPVLDLLGVGGAPAAGSVLTVLPIVVVMGYGELQIRRLRIDCRLAAATSITVRRYQRMAGAYLLRLEARIATACALATVLTMSAAQALGHGVIDAQQITQSAASIVLCCALITGLAGCALSRPLATACAFLISFGIIAGAGVAIPAFDVRAPGDHLACCLLLLALTNTVALRTVRNPISVIG